MRLNIAQKRRQHAHDFLSGYQAGVVGRKKVGFQVGKVGVLLDHVVVDRDLMQSPERIIILALYLDRLHVKFAIAQWLSIRVIKRDTLIFSTPIITLIFLDYQRL